MMIVEKTSTFPASRHRVFERLQRLETLQYIAAPYATFTPVDANESHIWAPGLTSSYRFRLLGFIPFGTHTINVLKFDEIEGISTKEGNEHVPVWNHDITLRAIDEDRTEYTDRVEVDAGWKTAFVYLWACRFYAHRQRKWIKLLSA